MLKLLKKYCEESGLSPEYMISHQRGRATAVFGNLLPQSMVDTLIAGGASVEAYRHHGTVHTIVSVPILD